MVTRSGTYQPLPSHLTPLAGCQGIPLPYGCVPLWLLVLGVGTLTPGSRAGLLPSSPLRTARASFPACRSSRLTSSDALLVSLAMTCGVEPLEVVAFSTSPGMYRGAVMEMDLLSIAQGLSTSRTLPTLGFG